MFGKTTSTLGTIPHDIHRIRRGAIAPFLSKQSVQQLEPKIQIVIEKLISRFHALQGTDTSVNLIHAFSALTGDIIAQYAFAETYGLMDSPDFAPWWQKAWIEVTENTHVLKQFGWLEPTLRMMPLWVMKIVNPGLVALVKLQDVGVAEE